MREEFLIFDLEEEFLRDVEIALQRLQIRHHVRVAVITLLREQPAEAEVVQLLPEREGALGDDLAIGHRALLH